MRKSRTTTKQAIQKETPSKQVITIRLDKDVLAQFRVHGPGYQTRINQVLRAHVRTSLTGCTAECDAALPSTREMRTQELRRSQPRVAGCVRRPPAKAIQLIRHLPDPN
jgi:hypothetical protein